MSGYVLLKSRMVSSASFACVQLYQTTSPSFFAAGTILFFHSAVAAWNFAGSAVADDAGARPCAEIRSGASAPATITAETERTATECQGAFIRILRWATHGPR